MSFWKKVFGKKENPLKSTTKWDEDVEIRLDDTVLTRDTLNIFDDREREQYIEGCLMQLLDAEKELHQLNYEYAVVTSHLTDMEELEALPPENLKIIREVAQQVCKIQQKQQSFAKENHMPDQEFEQMQQMEEEVEKGIQKLKETEEYRKTIKNDLRKLNGEKRAYESLQIELEEEVEGYVGLAKICFGSMAVCMLILLVLQFTLGLDTRLGYVLMVCVMALVIVRFYIRHNEAQKELTQVERSLNRLIILTNRVKIRYINNKNLLDYLQLKFHAESARELEASFAQYLKEKEQRRLLEEAELDYHYYQKELIKHLRISRIKDTSVWLHQAQAIIDPKEMVELRHRLIGRRQALREQMDYNRRLATVAKDELKDISQTYPQFAGEILHRMSRYEEPDT